MIFKDHVEGKINTKIRWPEYYIMLSQRKNWSLDKQPAALECEAGLALKELWEL